MDVIIVGGGPVGIATGLLLAHRDLEVLILEKNEQIYDLPRAITIDAEIQRVFQTLGLTEQLLSITTPLPGAEFVRPDGTRIMGMETPPTVERPYGHHPGICFYQPELEQLLRDAAIQHANIEVRLGTEAEQVEQDVDRVVVHTVDQAGASKTCSASWLVAADGASSPIRKSLDLAFVDQGFDQDWLVVDLELSTQVDNLPRFVQQICDPNRPTTFVTGHADYRRWEFQLQPGEDRAQMSDREQVWKLLQPWIGPDQARLIRAVVYQFHATVAERMRAGRIFLAGDAAHQMPPFLGQGLCSGIRDGANLAWKLAMVANGLAGDALLESYEQERLPHATRLVAHAVDLGNLIDQLSGRQTGETTAESGYGGGRPFPHLKEGICFGDHGAVGRQLRQPLVNGQLLDEILGDGPALIVADQTSCSPTVEKRWQAIGGRVVVIPPAVSAELMPDAQALLVRPDRYVAAVAAAAGDLPEIVDWFITGIGNNG